MKYLSILFVLSLAVLTASGGSCRGGVEGPPCGRSGDAECKDGYQCKAHQCCRHVCPPGHFGSSPCDREKPCQKKFECIEGFCCSKQDKRCPKNPIGQRPDDCEDRTPPFYVCRNSDVCGPLSYCCEDECGKDMVCRVPDSHPPGRK